MSLSQARAQIGLSAKLTVTGAESGSIQIGPPAQSVNLAAATKAWAADVLLVGNANTNQINLSDGTASPTAWNGGSAQVETATVVGSPTGGNVNVTVTAAGLAGSPLVVPVLTPSTGGVNAAAAAMRKALAANAAISALFYVGGVNASVVLTRLPLQVFDIDGTSIPVYPATDATLNIAIHGAAGITAASTSANTLPGAATTGCYAPGINGRDALGRLLSDFTTTEVTAYSVMIDPLSTVAPGVALDGVFSAGLAPGGSITTVRANVDATLGATISSAAGRVKATITVILQP